jgi:hypothetical protein
LDKATALLTLTSTAGALGEACTTITRDVAGAITSSSFEQEVRKPINNINVKECNSIFFI